MTERYIRAGILYASAGAGYAIYRPISDWAVGHPPANAGGSSDHLLPCPPIIVDVCVNYDTDGPLKFVREATVIRIRIFIEAEIFCKFFSV
jgi:hypothetical protein